MTIRTEKKEESTCKVKKDSKGKKVKMSRLEVALGAVMEGFGTTKKSRRRNFWTLKRISLK